MKYKLKAIQSWKINLPVIKKFFLNQDSELTLLKKN